MKKSKILLVILVIIILSGLIIPLFMDDLIFCTKKFCSCNGGNEIECNTCSVYNPVYFTIMVNAGTACSAKEIILCEDNIDAGRRYDKNECRMVWNSIFTEINREDGMVIFE